jgi:hypothetical protein
VFVLRSKASLACSTCGTRCALAARACCTMEQRLHWQPPLLGTTPGSRRYAHCLVRLMLAPPSSPTSGGTTVSSAQQVFWDRALCSKTLGLSFVVVAIATPGVAAWHHQAVRPACQGRTAVAQSPADRLSCCLCAGMCRLPCS